MRVILVKIYLRLIQQTPENIPLQERNPPQSVVILQHNDGQTNYTYFNSLMFEGSSVVYTKFSLRIGAHSARSHFERVLPVCGARKLASENSPPNIAKNAAKVNKPSLICWRTVSVEAERQGFAIYAAR